MAQLSKASLVSVHGMLPKLCKVFRDTCTLSLNTLIGKLYAESGSGMARSELLGWKISFTKLYIKGENIINCFP